MRNLIQKTKSIIAITLVVFSANVLAQSEPAVTISIAQLSESVYLLSGQGGNVGLSVGKDGAFLIDDELTAVTPKLLEAIRTITPEPIQFVINTHWHFDHVGGNELLGKSGSTIVAHSNVRKRMQEGQFVEAFNMEFPPANAAALPVVTFEHGLSFHINDDEIRVEAVAPAHTDGDAIVFFKEANIVHMGDLYWNGLYPLIDASSGGSIKGMVAGVAQVLEQIDANTQVIPGHGPLSNKPELAKYHHMLASSLKQVEALKRRGKTLEQIIAANPTAEFDQAWGKGLFTPEQWVAIVYSTL